MTFGVLSQMGAGSKQFIDRYAEYGTPVADPHVVYAYEPPTQGHVEASSKHTYGGGHKSNAAMSALTLLAFLFFLHILQQCIKDHMASMSTPQITIMTAGREGEAAVKEKLDKTGLTDNKNKNENELAENEKYLTKINTAQPPRYGANYKHAVKTYGEFVNAMDENN
ncbi:uncharacterized protein LOC114365986 [Ostrinia furnacalis]|uniref:uncharacterized protein LOC114365986 n=1 Tax=Ostrinia furnacalis TaxID=93504 RepID=UPI001040B7EF|nr:uncharacterized protein LOC114365986 [Ostrinia furnacalis]